ncbi:hypothetical protein BCR42DRAFT_451990 [Absidia repens]|uniref:Uncharacterized protein n=1 Tax=Absidia repens TaxID=90262 RepID=A0A1X2IEK2_9FUNG|nr:hypothetical protein BCR42DRAFT_451990 [Absidia repens]
MDVSSLLNSGGTSLTTEDLWGLLHCDNSEKLNQINNAVFQYPSATKETYRYFDIFIQLLLSILNNAGSGMQHTKPVIMAALRNCIKGILEQEGFNWLLVYPLHVSPDTWNQLKESTDKSLLRHLYGLQLGLKKQDSIELGAWTRSILHFLRVESPILTCHIWLNLCYLEEQRQQQHDMSTTDILDDQNKSVCLMFLDKVEYSGGASEMLQEVFSILQNGARSKLRDELENHLGGAILLHNFSQDEMVVSLVHFGNLVRSNKILYPLTKMSLDRFVYTVGPNSQNGGGKSKGKQKLAGGIGRNPLVNNDVRSEISDNVKERSLQVRHGTKWWLQQMGILLPIEFDMYLEELIMRLYPSGSKRVLDFVLVDWAARDPFGCHMELIVKNVMNLVDQQSFDTEIAPFYAWIQMFDLAHDTRLSEIEKGYNIKTGAEINLAKFNTKHDVALVNGLVKILQQMSLHSTTTSNLFILNCINVAAPEIVLGYVEWIVQLLNKEFDTSQDHHVTSLKSSTKSGRKSQQTTIAEHLEKVLMHPNVMSIASLLVPTILLQASDHTIAWLTNKKTDRVSSPARSGIHILMEYFSGGSHLSSKLLMTDLLRQKSRHYMDTLMGCLRSRMSDPLPSSAHSQSWFTRHFLGPILSEASNGNDNTASPTQTHTQQHQQQHQNQHQHQHQHQHQQQHQHQHQEQEQELELEQEQQKDDQDRPNVALQLLQTMLTGRTLFPWYFTTLVTSDRVHKLGAIEKLFMSQHHVIYSVRGTGLADMIQNLVQLDVAQQQRIVDMWIRLWTKPTTITDDNMDLDTREQQKQIAVPLDWILQCIGLYDQAPAVVKQMMECYMKLGIQSRVLNSEKAIESSNKESFTEMVMNLLMLSDTPEVDELFDLYIQLCYREKESSELDQEEIVQAVVRTLMILAEEIKLLFNSQSQSEDENIIATSGGDSGGDHDGGQVNDGTIGDELDQYTSMMEIDPVVDTTVDEQAMEIQGRNQYNAGKSRKLVQKLMAQQREHQVQRFTTARKKARKDRLERQKDQERESRKKQQQQQQQQLEFMHAHVYKNKMVTMLVQRLLNFILVVLSESGGNSLCPEARQSVRDKLVCNLLLYEPLATLIQLVELPSNTVDDIHMIVGLCLEILQKNGDTTTYNIIQRIIGD